MRKMLVSALFLLLLPALAFAQDEEVKIVHLGVGHGDCTLIIVKDYNNNRRPILQTISILIDAGEQTNGEELWNAVWSYINQAKGDRLDYLIVSHLHKDHVGGAEKLLEYLYEQYTNERRNKNRKYDWLEELEIFDRLSYNNKANPLYMPWHTSLPVNGFLANYKRISRLPMSKVTPRPLFVGTDILAAHNLRNSQMMCVAANGVIGKTREAPKKKNNDPISKLEVAENENDLNFAFLLRVGNFRYFTGGDLTGDSDPKKTDMETPLVREMDRAWGVAHPGETFHVCALKVGHHGSNRSSNGNFIDYMKPYMAVIEAGHRKFGSAPLPRVEVLGRFLGTQTLGITWRTAPPPLNYDYDIGKRLFFTYRFKKSPKSSKEFDPTEELKNQTTKSDLAKYLKNNFKNWRFARPQDIILSITGQSLSDKAKPEDAPAIKISRRLRNLTNMNLVRNKNEIPDPLPYTCDRRHGILVLPEYKGQ